MLTDIIKYDEMTIFVAMDHFNDRSIRMQINLNNGIPGVLMLYTDIRRMQDAGFPPTVIKDRIRHAIDESDAMLVIAGNYANEPQQSIEPIGATNWLHWCLEYAALVNKPILGFKINKSSPIPKPLRGLGIDWKKLTIKTLVTTLTKRHTEYIQSSNTCLQSRSRPKNGAMEMLEYSAKRLGIV